MKSISWVRIPQLQMRGKSDPFALSVFSAVILVIRHGQFQPPWKQKIAAIVNNDPGCIQLTYSPKHEGLF